MDDARAIVLDQNLQIVENPDVMDHQFLVYGGLDDIAGLAGWDEVSYIFPAADDLIQGSPVHGCVGALTTPRASRAIDSHFRRGMGRARPGQRQAELCVLRSDAQTARGSGGLRDCACFRGVGQVCEGDVHTNL